MLILVTHLALLVLVAREMLLECSLNYFIQSLILVNIISCCTPSSLIG